MSYDLLSGYYHVGLHPRSKIFVGFKWEGRYYVYNCLPFGLSTEPWVQSKVMRELVMYWRRGGIRLLPYLDNLMFMARDFWQCVKLARKVEADLVRAGLRINVPKCHTLPAQPRRQLGFDVNFAEGKFRVLVDRWHALIASVDAIVPARYGKVQARRLASLTGTVMSMHLSWGPVTQLYTRHLYALTNSVISLIFWVTLTEGAMSELLFWQGLRRADSRAISGRLRRDLHSDGVGRQRYRIGGGAHKGSCPGICPRRCLGGGELPVLDI